MKVGDKVWLFDINRRVYQKGVFGGEPIYSEYFYLVTIDGETSRSWLIGNQKFPKNNPLGLYTDEQKADNIWDNANRMIITDKLRNCSTEKLKQIDLILKNENDLGGIY